MSIDNFIYYTNDINNNYNKYYDHYYKINDVNKRLKKDYKMLLEYYRIEKNNNNIYCFIIISLIIYIIINKIY